jgi:LacI family transcriptional regulator
MTLKEIAERAEVSVSTVSLVLSGKGRVSATVREKVLSIARAFNYKRPLYDNMQSGTNLIGVLYHAEEKWSHVYRFIAPILRSIEEALSEKKLFHILIPCFSEEAASSVLDKIQNVGVRGLCSIHYANEDLFNTLEKRGIPVVLINNSSLQDKFSTVCVDDFQGAYEGTNYLLNLGHKDILFADYERATMLTTINDRFFGFQKALSEAGIKVREKQRITVHQLKGEELIEKLKKIFLQPAFPSAVFAHDDYMALHILTALKELGLSVPGDISVIAPGDVMDYTEPFIPKITTMKIDSEQMGALAGDMIINRLNPVRKEDVHTLKIRLKLVERDSCAPLV